MKKYFSISETSEITSLPINKLRYIEKSDPKIKVTKIRERRYYTRQHIDYIRKHHCGTVVAEPLSSNFIDNSSIIARIDTLIDKFHMLSANLC